jgi:hypothetical protein
MTFRQGYQCRNHVIWKNHEIRHPRRGFMWIYPSSWSINISTHALIQSEAVFTIRVYLWFRVHEWHLPTTAIPYHSSQMARPWSSSEPWLVRVNWAIRRFVVTLYYSQLYFISLSWSTEFPWRQMHFAKSCRVILDTVSYLEFGKCVIASFNFPNGRQFTRPARCSPPRAWMIEAPSSADSLLALWCFILRDPSQHIRLMKGLTIRRYFSDKWSSCPLQFQRTIGDHVPVWSCWMPRWLVEAVGPCDDFLSWHTGLDGLGHMAEQRIG